MCPNNNETCINWLRDFHLAYHSYDPSTCELLPAPALHEISPPNQDPIEDPISLPFEEEKFGDEWKLSQILLSMREALPPRSGSPTKRQRDVSGSAQSSSKKLVSGDSNSVNIDNSSTPLTSVTAPGAQSEQTVSITTASRNRKAACDDLAKMSPYVKFDITKAQIKMLTDLRVSKDSKAMLQKILAFTSRLGIMPDIVTEDPTVNSSCGHMDMFFGRQPVNQQESLAIYDDKWEFSIILEIVENTIDCKTWKMDESAWCDSFHFKLLALAVKFTAGIKCINVTTARILDQFKPIAELRAVGDVTLSRMLDYAIVIRPAGDLAQAIFDILQVQPEKEDIINQRDKSSLSSCPAAVHIESKKPDVKEDGRVQLAVWIASLHKRFYSLFGNSVSIHSIPLLTAKGSEWNLYMACQEGNGIVILGPWHLGGTDGILECYQLLACLRALVD